MPVELHLQHVPEALAPVSDKGKAWSEFFYYHVVENTRSHSNVMQY